VGKAHYRHYRPFAAKTLAALICPQTDLAVAPRHSLSETFITDDSPVIRLRKVIPLVIFYRL